MRPTVRIAIAASLLLALVAAVEAQVIEVGPFALGINASATPEIGGRRRRHDDGRLGHAGGLGRWPWRAGSPRTATRWAPASASTSPARCVEATISAVPQGGYVVVWHRRPFNKRSAFYARRLDGNAVPLGSETEVTPGNPILPEAADLATLPSGAVVAWRNGALFGRLLDSAGNPRELFEIGTGGDTREIAALADGSFAVAWRAVDDGRLRFFEANALPRTDALDIGDVARARWSSTRRARWWWSRRAVRRPAFGCSVSRTRA